MNGRSSLTTFFLLLLLIVIIVLQILSMVQTDRLYERLNILIDTFKSVEPTGPTKQKPISANLPMDEYPGDEGDWLIWCLRSEPRTLNPFSDEVDIYSSYVTGRNIFESLLDYDFDDVKLKPWLADSFEVSDDGLEITFWLRDCLHFSDGVAITADDIVFSFETIINPGVDAAIKRNLYSDVKCVEKINARTIKFIFIESCWKNIEHAGLFKVLPKHIYQFSDAAQFNPDVSGRSNPVGSGPYIFEKWQTGRKIVLRRNENYWGHKPKLKKIVYRFITNPLAALQTLRAHEVDLLIPTPEQFLQLSNDPDKSGFSEDFQLLSYWTPGVPFYFVAWNQLCDCFKDRRVRLAMTHIIDRQAIVKHLLKGNARLITGPFYIFGPQNDPNIEPWPYNPERAEQLLNEAGWKDNNGDGIRDKAGTSLRFKFSYPAGSTLYKQIARLFKETAAKVGVDVIADPYEWSTFFERVNNRRFEAAIMGRGGDFETDPYAFFHSSQVFGSGSNFVGFSNPQVDAIIEKARHTLDENKRYALYHRFHRLIHKEQPYTFLFTRAAFRFIDRRFQNITVHKLGLNKYQWYVPKDKQRYK